MYEVIMVIDGCEYHYTTDSDRNRANQTAIQVREMRGCETYVVECDK